MKPKKKAITRQAYQQPDLLIMPDATPDELRTAAATLTVQVAAIQDSIALSNGAFAKPYANMDPSTWGRLRATFIDGQEKYSVQDWRPIIAKLQGAIALRGSKAGKADVPQDTVPLTLPPGLVKFSFHQPIIDAVTAAMATPRDRLIPVLGKTGYGKTCLGQILRASFPTKALFTTASRPWITRYAPLFRSLAQSLGLAKIPRSAYELQEKVIGLLKVSQRVIIIDGFQYAGTPTVDGVKYICENTDCPIVFLTTPEQYKHIKDGDWDNVDQVLNRIYQQFNLDSLPVEDVMNVASQALPQFQELPESERSKICTRLINAGNHFGGWNKIDGLCKAVALRSCPPGKDPLPISEKSFIKAQEDLAQMGRY